LRSRLRLDFESRRSRSRLDYGGRHALEAREAV
jgi:hypothetical protein